MRGENYEDGLPSVCCDICENWLHLHCAARRRLGAMSAEEIERWSAKDFTCKRCRDAQRKSKAQTQNAKSQAPSANAKKKSATKSSSDEQPKQPKSSDSKKRKSGDLTKSSKKAKIDSHPVSVIVKTVVEQSTPKEVDQPKKFQVENSMNMAN